MGAVDDAPTPLGDEAAATDEFEFEVEYAGTETGVGNAAVVVGLVVVCATFLVCFLPVT